MNRKRSHSWTLTDAKSCNFRSVRRRSPSIEFLGESHVERPIFVVTLDDDSEPIQRQQNRIARRRANSTIQQPTSSGISTFNAFAAPWAPVRSTLTGRRPTMETEEIMVVEESAEPEPAQEPSLLYVIGGESVAVMKRHLKRLNNLDEIFARLACIAFRNEVVASGTVDCDEKNFLKMIQVAEYAISFMADKKKRGKAKDCSIVLESSLRMFRRLSQKLHEKLGSSASNEMSQVDFVDEVFNLSLEQECLTIDDNDEPTITEPVAKRRGRPRRSSTPYPSNTRIATSGTNSSDQRTVTVSSTSTQLTTSTDSSVNCSRMKYKCPLAGCHRRMMHDYILEKHLMQHDKPEKFICTECGSGFPAKSSLNSHMSVHQPSSGFACDQCSYRYKTKAPLTNHKKACHSSTFAGLF